MVGKGWWGRVVGKGWCGRGGGLLVAFAGGSGVLGVHCS